MPLELYDVLGQILRKPSLVKSHQFQEPATKSCLDCFEKRLDDLPSNLKDPRGIRDWLFDDVRTFMKERARFNFRESFQPPAALIADPQGLLSDKTVTAFNALHIARYYHAQYYADLDEWRTQTGYALTEEEAAADVVAYCRLLCLRDRPIRLHFTLNARHLSQDAWEEKHAYQITALHGLEVVSPDDPTQDLSTRHMFRTQFIPAFVVLNAGRAYNQLLLLRKKALIYPMQLSVTFAQSKVREYSIVLGSMAFHVCAEMPYWAMKRDRRKTQAEDDELLLC
jgi:hypothetical protein